MSIDGDPAPRSGITPRLERRISADYPGRAGEIVELLAQTESGNQNRERVIAAIVIGSHGDVDDLRRLVELSRIDWRDVLVEGGLAYPDWPAQLDHHLGTESEWDEHAAGWDDNEAVRAYADAADASLTALVDQNGLELAGATACDFGCGTGLLTERLVRRCRHIDAIDTSTAMREVVATKIERNGWQTVRLLDRLPTEPSTLR